MGVTITVGPHSRKALHDLTRQALDGVGRKRATLCLKEVMCAAVESASIRRRGSMESAPRLGVNDS